MKEWFSLAELAQMQLPDLPHNMAGLHRVATEANWREHPTHARKVKGPTKPVWLYHIALLPAPARTRIEMAASAVAPEEWDAIRTRKNQLWARFERLSNEHRDICKARLSVLCRVETLAAQKGVSRAAAIAIATSEAEVQKSTYYEWKGLTEGLDRDDWLAALAPSFSPAVDGVVADVADCHPDAWTFLKSDYLRPEKPAFSACYRRMMTVAKREKWAPIPSERSLRRRFEREVGKAVTLFKREGRDKAKALYPAQRRSRAHLHAMQMVNMDGHKVDVFVSVPWKKEPTRMFIIGIQDLFSGKILSWRLSESETWEAVRLVIGDMVEAFGIPEDIYLDNGRAFASKWITGGTVNRFRFKVKPEDPRGLLTTLGVEVHWTRPYSGQSKPIERAWRDLAENIAKHPFCAGAYSGNKPDAKPWNYMERAIPLEDFRMHVAAQIVEHNAQAGRRAENCKGRSFDETFAASMAAPSTIVRVPSNAQAALWLLASEAIKTQKSNGGIHFQGNRYWSGELNQWAGKQVIIRFDPDFLHKPIKVYDLKNRLICEAACVDDAGFKSRDDARAHSRLASTHTKAVAAKAEAEAALSAQQLGEIYYKGSKPPKPADVPETVRPAVTRLITRSQQVEAPVDAISDQHFEDSFSRALGLVQGGGVIEFPRGNSPVSRVSDTGKNEPKSIAYGSGKKKGSPKTAR
ncbi:DDE-type integrase/transposase/recombinase [Agrobacterium vitis]|uniref:transposase domain-containing protein n=1 Tax=Allorhizobium ampelinum TaxID=3025782 RepID=UPI001F176010|nr:transposase domain-containing protein [Allorhizobium ampelinum]MCF1485051.1 DDE-type integrase/transposase/recombinase [Allorhizobium ampelinum]